MEKKPLVSVYIITFNRAQLLSRALSSVVNQTYKNLEIIIIDDRSTDETIELINSFSNDDARIKYFINDKNSGACYSRNRAIDYSSGEYITGLDDDDYFLPDRIQDFIESKNLLNDYVLLYNNVIWKTPYGLNKAKINKFFKKKVSSHDLLIFNYIGNQIFTKTEILKNNKFDVNLKSWQDLECWYALLSSTNGFARCLPSYNYIQDISHPHERISSSKIEKIKSSFELIVKKHALSYKEQSLLKNHLIMYGLPTFDSFRTIIFTYTELSISSILISIRNLSFILFNRRR